MQKEMRAVIADDELEPVLIGAVTDATGEVPDTEGEDDDNIVWGQEA